MFSYMVLISPISDDGGGFDSKNASGFLSVILLVLENGSQ
uniref:Uncharacterized protein n=1 Tax=Rhizophora mucronata TaxID=61149 RepID=A0A2P2JW75_RHIMU